MKTREEIITAMCYTYRHDYGILDSQKQKGIHATMAQIFDNDIKPYMEFRGWDEYSGMPAVKDYTLPLSVNVPIH